MCILKDLDPHWNLFINQIKFQYKQKKIVFIIQICIIYFYIAFLEPHSITFADHGI